MTGVRIADKPDQAFPEDRTPAGRSRVYVDQFSGTVRLVENTRTAPLGTRILNLKRSAHTGDIFGAPTQALYFLVSLGIALQAITGAFIWMNARKREPGTEMTEGTVIHGATEQQRRTEKIDFLFSCSFPFLRSSVLIPLPP